MKKIIIVFLLIIVFIYGSAFEVHAGTTYVAEKGGSTYHETDCRYVEGYVKQYPEYLDTFDSQEDAKDAGLQPCVMCIASDALLPVPVVDAKENEGTEGPNPAMISEEGSDMYSYSDDPPSNSGTSIPWLCWVYAIIGFVTGVIIATLVYIRRFIKLRESYEANIRKIRAVIHSILTLVPDE